MSSNGIHFLPDKEYLAKLKNLQYLQLHKNEIVGYKQLNNLTCLKELRHLTLQGNPCAKVKGYRSLLVEAMPSIRSLDSYIVMDYERQDIAKMFPPENLSKQKLIELNRFRPFNKTYNYWASTKFIIYDPFIEKKLMELIPRTDQAESSSSDDDLYDRHQYQRSILREDFQLTTDEVGINRHLKAQMYDLRRKFEYCSPILTIQKTVKRWIYRKRYIRKCKMIGLLVWSLNRWHKRFWQERYLKGCNLTRAELYRIGKIRFVQRKIRSLQHKWTIDQRIARRGQTIFRMKRVQDKSFHIAFDFDERQHRTSNCKTRKLLFRKSQHRLIERLGLANYACRGEVSQDFGVRTGIEIDTIKFRRSILLNMVISSYRNARIMRSHDFFLQLIKLAQEAKKSISKTKSTTNNEENLADPNDQIPAAPVASVSNPTYDEDKILYELTYDNDYDFAQTIFAIASYNRRHPIVIEVFYEPFLRRLKAILKLQHWFRDVLFKKRQKPIFKTRGTGDYVLDGSLLGRPICAENTMQMHFILLQKIAGRISRVWRKRCLTMRIKALSNIAKYVNAIDSNELYLEQTMYLNLQTVYKKAMGVPWHKKLDVTSEKKTVKKSPKKQKILQEAQEMMPSTYFEVFFERRFRFEVSGKDQTVHIAFPLLIDPASRYSQSNLPVWFQRASQTEIPKMNLKRKIPHQDNIFTLVHQTANSGITGSAPRIMYLNELDGIHVEAEFAKTKLVKIELPSIQEAKNRAIVLALLTADVRRSSDKFFRFFTHSDLVGKKQKKSFHLISKGLRVHRLVDKDATTFLSPSFMTLKQVHNGVIRKREEPYRTLLRARPKDKKSHLERFIVLGDADPRHVEEALGSQLISEQIVNYLGTNSSQGGESTDGLGFDASPHSVQINKDSSMRGRTSIKTLDSDDWSKINKKPKQFTQGDIAKMKLTLQHNRDKINKIEALKRKLTHVKQRIDDNNLIDPCFKKLFVKAMLPLLANSSRKVNITDPNDITQQKDQATQAMIFEMPRTDIDISDPQVGVNFSEENLDSQIKNLFDEYLRHQRAFREAESKSKIKHKLKKLDRGPSQFQTDSGSSEHYLRTDEDTLVDEKSIQKDTNNVNILETNMITKQSSSVTLDAKAQITDVSKFSEQRQTNQDEYQQILTSGRMREQRISNLAIKQNKSITTLQKVETRDFHRDFVNQSNKLNDLTLKTKKNAYQISTQAALQETVLKVRSNQLQSSLSQQSFMPAQQMSAKTALQETVLKMRSKQLQPSLSQKSLMQAQQMSAQATFGEEKRRQVMYEAKMMHVPVESALPKVSPSLFKDALSHRVLHPISDKKKELKSMKEHEDEQIEVVPMQFNTEDLYQQSPEKKQNVVYGIGSGRNSTSQWTMPEIKNKEDSSKVNHFRIPVYAGGASARKKASNNAQANKDLMLKVQATAALHKSESASQISSVVARLKTRAIIQDINKMQEKRSVLQSQQSSARLNDQREGLQTERANRNNEISYSVQKRKILALVSQQKKDNLVERKTQRGYFKALAPIPKKLQPLDPKKQRNIQRQAGTSIENIMKTRKEFKDSDSTFQMLGRDLLKSQVIPAKSGAAFTYEKQNAITPLDSLVGVSRTASTNQFTSRLSQNNRKLSMLPLLVHNRSVGRLTPLI